MPLHMRALTWFSTDQLGSFYQILCLSRMNTKLNWPGKQARLLIYIWFSSVHLPCGRKGCGTLPIEQGLLASILVGVSIECNFLDTLNTIEHEWRTPIK